MTKYIYVVVLQCRMADRWEDVETYHPSEEETALEDRDGYVNAGWGDQFRVIHRRTPNRICY